MLPAAAPVRVEVRPFEEVAAAALDSLQVALAALVAALPGKVTRAVDVQRSLDLDKKLGWQLFTFATAPRSIDEIASVPGAPSMRRILAAAAKRRVPRAVIDRAAAAFEEFEGFVAEHGGDRDELVSLARGLSSDADPQHELRVRKSVFRGLAHVWGVRAATLVRTAVIHPGAPGPEHTEDVLVVVGYIGLQRLRRGVPFAVSSTLGVQNDPADSAPASPPAPGIGPMEVLGEYSSRPLPEMVSRADSAGDRETELVFPPSGRAGAVTLCTAQRIASAWSGVQSLHALNSLVKVPTVSYVCELLVPSGWTDPGTARASIYGRRGAVERVDEVRTIDLLPQREPVTCFTGITAPPPLADAPRHHEAVAAMLTRLGWNDTTYDLYRSVVEYPVLHTMIRVAVDANPSR